MTKNYLGETGIAHLWGKTKGLFNELSSEIVNLQSPQIIAESPEYAETTSEMTDTNKVYLGSNGNLWAYEQTEVVNKHNAYDEQTALFNYRLSSSGTNSAYDGVVVLDYQEVSLTNPYIVKVRGVEIRHNASLGYGYRISYYGESKNHIGSISKAAPDIVDEYSLDIYNATYSSARYVRISICLNTNGASISKTDCQNLEVEFIPKTVTEIQDGWKDTEIHYANYELTGTDADLIVDKMLDRLDVSYVSSDKVLTVGTYTFRYDGTGIADIGESS